MLLAPSSLLRPAGPSTGSSRRSLPNSPRGEHGTWGSEGTPSLWEGGLVREGGEVRRLDERARQGTGPSPDTVSLAPWLTRALAMFEATQWKTPLSSARSPVICRTPLGSSVYLLGKGTRLTPSTATGTAGHRDPEPHRHSPAPRFRPKVTVTIRHTQADAPATPALTTIRALLTMHP